MLELGEFGCSNDLVNYYKETGHLYFIETNVSDARIMILIMRANQTFLTQSRAIIPGRLRSIGQRVTLIFLLNLTTY